MKNDLIWVGITGFGPDSNEAAYDPILQGRGGLMELTGNTDCNPVLIGIPLPDMGTSEHAYGLIMKGILQKTILHRGCRLDVSMFESTVSWLTTPLYLSTNFGKHLSRRGNKHEFFAPSNVYKTRDGYVFIASGNDRQWESIVSLPPFQGLTKDEYKRNAGRPAESPMWIV